MFFKSKLRNKNLSKKGLTTIVSTSLFIFISIVGFFSLQTFYLDYTSELKNKFNTEGSESSLQIIGVKSDNSNKSIILKNSFENYIQINEIKVNNDKCSFYDNVVPGKNYMDLDLSECGVFVSSNVDVVVITSSGIFDKKLIVREK